MIGSFGEVYLVDWGIAVSLTADPLGRLPLAADQNEMAGTPCYMAPEMLGALGKLSVRTGGGLPDRVRRRVCLPGVPLQHHERRELRAPRDVPRRVVAAHRGCRALHPRGTASAAISVACT